MLPQIWVDFCLKHQQISTGHVRVISKLEYILFMPQSWFNGKMGVSPIFRLLSFKGHIPLNPGRTGSDYGNGTPSPEP